MSLEDVCNEDMLVKFTQTAGPPDSVYLGDQGIDLVKVVPTLSTKNKAAAKKVATTGVTITWPVSGCAFTSATYTFVSGGGMVATSATKTKAEAQLVLRKGDTGTCVGGWTLTAPPNTPLACACNVEISNAGQTKAKAQ
jgi:hypothetical protein